MPDGSLLNDFRNFLSRTSLLKKNDKIIVSVSGGIDSMVLLDLLLSIKDSLKITLAVAHFNHQLRGVESNEDESFVRNHTKTLGIECYVEHANTQSIAELKHESIQVVARNLRYAFFERLRASLKFDMIATAHHADDNAETLLFNLIRGTGVHGLSGIPLRRKNPRVIRPLLFATRNQIISHATAMAIPYREDSSNSTNDYSRNYLRHEIIPLLRENLNPNLSGTLGRTSRIFAELEEYLFEVASTIVNKIIEQRTDGYLVIDILKWEKQPPFLRDYIIVLALRRFLNEDIEFTTIQDLIQLIKSETGSRCSLRGNVIAYKDRSKLILERSIHTLQNFRMDVEPGQNYHHEKFTFSSTLVDEVYFSCDPSVEFADFEKLKDKPLYLRQWVDGDWFIPFGMQTRKKVSDYLIDEKISLREKRRIPLLVAGEDIVWICGHRLDDRFKITEATKTMLKLEFHLHRH